MSLRPAQARWFELLTTREHLALALETLAGTGCIELDIHDGAHTAVSLLNLQERLQAYERMARRYRPYWPRSPRRPATTTGKPAAILDAALQRLQAWEAAALPQIRRIEVLASEQADLALLAAMLRQPQAQGLDYALVARPGTTLAVRLFALPAGCDSGPLPQTVLVRRVSSAGTDFLLALGLPEAVERLATQLAACKGRVVAIPDWLSGTREAAHEQVVGRSEAVARELRGCRAAIDALAADHVLTGALGDIERLAWLAGNLSSFPVSENFAWITGWTSDLTDARLNAALAAAGVNAVLHFPAPPRGLTAPVVMRNPPWARPFELFARMLGTPAREEADPSRLLVILVPLLFGYMFGDVGHGVVLVGAGLLLARRWPPARILIANGTAAMLFGLVFGSVFGREDIVPALWLQPMAQPLPVLLVPLVAGAAILLLGLLLQALQSAWRGELRRWLHVEAPVILLYLSLLATPLLSAAWVLALFAVIWYLAGSTLAARARPLVALAAAAGGLLESILQLLINTVSFVRVGAFALAHSGLSLAFITLADATASTPAGLLILLLGNLLVITLEGLVVTIQTTRLVLFEFFIRFLSATGRTFRPLAAPTATVAMRRVT